MDTERTTLALRAIIGIGSNMGERLETMRAAVHKLGAIAHLERVSHVYETKPVGGPEAQGAYLNAAARITYDGAALDLLDALQGIESSLGRARLEHWGPRTIDLDILWIEGLAMESERLTVPHPLLVERPFALRPLVDVAPDAIDPFTQLPYVRLVDHETAMMRPAKMDLAGPS